MPGSYIQFDASSAAEALEIAERLKEEGRYRYFRGQRDSAWPVSSSFARLGLAERVLAQQHAGSFYAWATDSVGLVPYLDDEDKVLATIQHHQIAKTTLIDFTTSPSVAVWFAMDDAVTGGEGAVYLVNPAEVANVFEAMCRSGPVVRFLHVEVPNLWRLQAQKGLFLEAQVDVSSFWPFDRIVFPHTAEEPPVNPRLIYPDRRSQLELAIDEYLRLRNQEARMSEFMAETPGTCHLQIKVEDEDLLPSLDHSTLPMEWVKGPHEPWSDVDIVTQPPTLFLSDIIRGGEGLVEVITTRRRATDLLIVDELTDAVSALQPALDRLWEGMRPYAYSPQQIAHAIQRTAFYLAAFVGANRNSDMGLLGVALKLLDDPVEVEIGMAVGSTRAFVASRSLWACLTPVSRKAMSIEEPPTGQDLMALLAPRYGATLDLFDAMSLVDLFASEIVPWQLAGERPVLCFAPMNIERLVLP